MKLRPSATYSLLACSLALPVVADSVDSISTEIITTATRTPIEISDSLSAVTVLERIDIERYQAADLYGLLSRVPGVSFVRNGGRGSSTSLLLRGNQSDHSLFLIDGVRIGSATLGSASLSALNTNLIERIEIIRGPKSNLYGADAIGGVVNIITRKLTDPKALSIATSFGSNNTSETTLAGGLNGDDYSFTVVANSLNTDGIDNTTSKAGVNGDKDAHRNNSLVLNYQHQLSDALNVKIAYHRNDSESEYDTNCTDSTTFASLDCNIYSTNLVDSLSALFEYKVSDSWTTSFQLGRTKDESENLADNIDASTTFSGGEFNTTKEEVTWVNNLSIGDDNVLTAGLDYQLDEVDSSTNYDETSRSNKAAFVQLQSSFGFVDTNIGVRHDDNEQFGEHTTTSFQAGFDVADNVRVLASYSEGFKAPTFNDLYFPFFGDPTFEPEESKNYELGINATFENAYISVAAFRNDLENLIQYNPAIFASDQTAKAKISGIEFRVETEISGWELGFTGSVIDPENESNGKLLRRRAEQSATFDADYAMDDFSVGLSARVESNRYDDVANTVKLSGYATYALRAQYRINNEWTIKAKVNNLTDEDYATAVDFSLGEYRSLGREAFVSVVYTPSF